MKLSGTTGVVWPRDVTSRTGKLVIISNYLITCLLKTDKITDVLSLNTGTVPD